MAKHILIASDDSDNALRAIVFVGSHMSNDCDVTLYSVVPDTETLCSMKSPELTSYFLEQQSAFCALEDKKKELLSAVLKKGRQHLIDCGFDGNRVTIKLNKIDRIKICPW